MPKWVPSRTWSPGRASCSGIGAAVLAAWIVVFLIGGFASSKLSAILSNTFSVPGTASETVRHDLEVHYGDRSDGSFTVVFELPKGAASAAPALRQELATAVGRAAAAVPGGKPLNFNVATTPAGKTVVYGDISSTLNLAQAKGYTDKVIAALGTPPGSRTSTSPAPPRSSTTSTRSSTAT